MNCYSSNTIPLFYSTVTPMQSMFSHLVHEQSTAERTVKKLKFVWIQRDPELLVESTVADTSVSLHNSRHAILEESQHSIADDYDHNGASLASKILGMVPSGDETDQKLEELYPSYEDLTNYDKTMVEDDEDLTIDVEALGEDAKDDYPGKKLMPSEKFQMLPEEPNCYTQMEMGRLDKVLDIEIYLTQKEANASRTDHIPSVKVGRPELALLFIQMKEEAIRLGEKRVAVCVCGPKRVSSLCRKACIVLSDNTVRFDYHEEAFG